MNSFLAGIAQAGRELLGINGSHPSAEEVAAHCHRLMKLKGEASAIALADSVHAAYAALDGSERLRFFRILRDRFEPANEAVAQAITAWQNNPDPQRLVNLNRATESSRCELIRTLNVAPGGTAGLVSMRSDLLEALDEDAGLAPVNDDFLHVFQSWFNRGFLRLETINWQTPAETLEKLIAYEAVHEIRGWDDLRRRLAEDRRCFAFFHPALPGEPLIFVQVALVEGLASSIETLLAPGDATAAAPDTAVFYSISNCQQGLSGVSFGNFLIKQVVDMLARDVPSLKHYATLSPVPGFRRWLAAELDNSNGESTLAAADRDKLASLDAPDWHDDPRSTKALAPLLRKLCARYLLHARRGAEPLDPVARFHLRNGAHLERINWLADPSDKGMQQSLGLMVNYVYERKAVLANHEAFVNKGRIAASKAIVRLAG